jgi:polynucleotide 5'-kinase involved in rRNA processing
MKRNIREEEEIKEEEEKEPIKIMVVGPPGVGKSTFCNFFIDG